MLLLAVAVFDQEAFLKIEFNTGPESYFFSFSVGHVHPLRARKSKVMTKDVLNTLAINLERLTWFATWYEKHTEVAASHFGPHFDILEGNFICQWLYENM